MDTIKLDLGPGFILKNYFSSPRKVRGGRSQKFYHIIVKDTYNREIKKIVPFLRYNPSTKVYDTIEKLYQCNYDAEIICYKNESYYKDFKNKRRSIKMF